MEKQYWRTTKVWLATILSVEKKMTSPKRTLYHHMLRGALWSLLMRWSMKLIGLVNTIILARLLIPEDFGIAAMASLIVGLLYSCSELGMQSLLIREHHVEKDHCDTAWTLQIIHHLLIALILLSTASLAATYFNEPRVVPVIHLLAFGAIIGGFSNIGVVFFRKNLDFDQDFKFEVYKRILLFIVTISLAFALRTYWALVISQVIGISLGVLLSYHIHPYRPKFSLKRIREFFSFASSILPLSIGKFMNNKVDVLVMGGLATTGQLGTYNIASDLASMATKEIVTPIGRGLYPNFAKLTHNPNQLAASFLHVLSVVSIVCLPIGTGLWIVADDFVLVVLGGQWMPVVPIIKWLTIHATISSLIIFMSGHILIVTGHERLSAIIMWVRVISLGTLVSLAGLLGGITYIAPAAALSTIIVYPYTVRCLSRAIHITYDKILSISWRPVVSSIVMAATINSMELRNNPASTLLLQSVLGAITYSVLIYLLWVVARKPVGIEQVVANFFAIRIKRLI